MEFLAELSQHIPNTFEQTTRYFGCYSARTRGRARREKRFRAFVENNFEPLEESPLPERRPSATWARLIKRVYEIDPLVCPKCGEGMKIVAFLQSLGEIEKIASNLGYVTWRAPPALVSKHSHLDTSAEFDQSASF